MNNIIKTENIKDYTLANGLRVLILEDHKAPLASVQYWVKTGSIDEDKYLGHGLSHFLEHMIFKGSVKYHKKPIAEILEAYGGYINAYTSKDHTVYYADVPSSHAIETLDILSDSIINPLLPADDFKNEKEIILRERAMNKDKPSRTLHETSFELLFRDHPASVPVIGYEDKIRKVNRKMMLDYFNKRYRPYNSILIITGDVDANKIISHINSSEIVNWERGNMQPVSLPGFAVQSSFLRKESFFKDPLVRMNLFIKLPVSSNNDIIVMDVLSEILGGSNSSRLEQKLKNKEQLAISISSYAYTSTYSGIFGVTATCKPKNAKRLEKRIFEEMSLLTTEVPNLPELKRVITQTQLYFIENLQTVSSKANMIGDAVFTFGDPGYWNVYMAKIKAIKPNDILHIAQKYFVPEKYVFVVQSPEDQKSKSLQETNIKEVNITKNKKYTDNFVKYLTLPVNDLPLVNISIVFPGGTFMETPATSGATTLISRLILAGTTNYSEEELASILDDNGINLRASSGNNTFTIKLSCLSEKLDMGLKILQEVITKPLFPKNAFKREQNNLIESIKSMKTQPIYKARRLLEKAMYQNHPYSLPSMGSIDSIANMNTETLKKFYSQKILQNKKTVISIAGNFEGHNIAAEIKSLIDSITWNENSNTEPLKPEFKGRKELLTSKLDKEQAIILLAIPGATATSTDRYTFNILSTALNGQSSRLFKSIREEKGLAYSTGAFMRLGIDKGFFSIYVSVAPEKVKQTLIMLDKIYAELQKDGISKQEFKEAIAVIKNDHSVAQQEIKNISMRTALDEFYGIDYKIFFTENDIYNNLSYKKVNAKIKQILANKRQITVVVGNIDTEKIKGK